MKSDNEGAGSIMGIPPILLIFVVIVILFVLLGGFIVIVFATKTLITLALLGVGLFLLVKPAIVKGHTYIPMLLILASILLFLFGG